MSVARESRAEPRRLRADCVVGEQQSHEVKRGRGRVGAHGLSITGKASFEGLLGAVRPDHGEVDQAHGLVGASACWARDARHADPHVAAKGLTNAFGQRDRNLC